MAACGRLEVNAFTSRRADGYPAGLFCMLPSRGPSRTVHAVDKRDDGSVHLFSTFLDRQSRTTPVLFATLSVTPPCSPPPPLPAAFLAVERYVETRDPCTA